MTNLSEAVDAREVPAAEPRPQIDAGLGWRTTPTAIALGGLVIGLVLGLAVSGVPVLGYLDGNAGQFWTTFAIGAIATLVGAVAGLALSWKAWVPARDWLRDPNGGVSAEAAWEAATRFPRRLVVTSGAVIAVLAVPPAILYWAAEFDLNAWEALGAAAGGLTGLAATAALYLACAELALKPLVARIATALPPEWQGHGSRWNVGAKVMTAFPILAATAVISAGVLIPDNASPATKLAISVGAALAAVLLVSVPLMLIVTGTILEPLRQLRAGTVRVGRGDYSTSIPPTTADEFGELVASFNRMQHGLEERQRLTGENAELLDEVRASRSRIVSASDAERRRVERNLHDGAQQRLVALALRLRVVEERLADDPELRAMVADANGELTGATEELRELARGLHPQVLSAGGLAPAIEQLAERAPVPVEVRAPPERYPEAVESTAYFVASEALANVAKYAQAKRAEVSAERRNGNLVLAISDDGVGGADLEAGSGLTGLADRVAALDGRLSVESPAGEGTTVTVELPLDDGAAR